MATSVRTLSLGGILSQNPKVHHNLSMAELVERALARGEGVLAASGSLRVTTGRYTGRSPRDKYIVQDPSVKDQIDWGSVNQPLNPAVFDSLYQRMLSHLSDRELYVFDGFAGAHPRFRIPIRVINEFAWQNLFARQLFLRPTAADRPDRDPEFTVIAAPTFRANPRQDGLHSETFIALSLERRMVLIGGTHYAGEIKKSIFSALNYLLPQQGVFPMHCSANVGEGGDVALFFGLSGTGKTTLSADPTRRLIGDDEHGWSDEGVFNFEGGCYAKCIGLSAEKEPQIYHAIRFGTVLENVVLDDETRVPNFDDGALTENTRAAYPVDYIPNAVPEGVGGHPSTVVFLTADAFGVLPPIARLTREQALYYFISGYTSKLAGTERGVTQPQATFSPCFAGPFLPLPAHRYADLLGEKLERHNVQVYLINTGWSGGPYGVGRRMDLRHTRAMVTSALNGGLDGVEHRPDPVFGLQVPTQVPGVPSEVLQPRQTWADPEAYDRQARELAALFARNIAQFEGLPEEVLAAGPQVTAES